MLVRKVRYNKIKKIYRKDINIFRPIWEHQKFYFNAFLYPEVSNVRIRALEALLSDVKYAGVVISILEKKLQNVKGIKERIYSLKVVLELKKNRKHTKNLIQFLTREFAVNHSYDSLPWIYNTFFIFFNTYGQQIFSYGNTEYNVMLKKMLDKIITANPIVLQEYAQLQSLNELLHNLQLLKNDDFEVHT